LNELPDSLALAPLKERQLRAVAALPLAIDGTTIGALTVFSQTAGVFDPAELKIFQELTANLRFALQFLQKDEALQFLSYFDGLTGLAKRTLFVQRLAQRLNSLTAERVLRILVLDVQSLRAVNDSLGRHAGDLLIAEIGARLKENSDDTE